LVLTIAVGVQDKPADAPATPGPYKSDYKLFGDAAPAEAFASLSSIVFAYAGTPAFFNIASEMREPRHYTRAVIICQSVMTAVYIAIGCVVYYFCGSYVASPALGSAGPTMKKVCYGLALPGLIVSTTLFVHVS
jgi:amino acid permease